MNTSTACGLLAYLTASALGQTTTKDASSRPAGKPRVVKMALHPAGEPRPSLTYRLLPVLLDQEPGNAATVYLTGCLMAPPDEARREARENCDRWLDVPLKDVPRDEARKVVELYKSGLRQIEIATFRESCEWDQPIRHEGYSLLLPSLAKLRGLNRALALRIRLNLAEGNTDAVLRDFQIGYAMSRHIADAPTLIQSLVAVSCGSLLTKQLETFMTTAACPNLYWALTELPRPFVDCCRSLRWERAVLFLQWPVLRDPKKANLSPQQWDEMAMEIAAFGSWGKPRKSEAEVRRWLAAEEARVYPTANAYLLAQGMTSEKVEAMPTKQALAIYLVDHYRLWVDDYVKWWHLPYWQGSEGAQAVATALDGPKGQDDSAVLARVLLPALNKACFLLHRFDSHIAALRCIEAIRLYAAKHGGRLPASLTDVTEVPIPIDPLTGEAFRYKMAGDKGILEMGRVPPSTDPKDLWRYELTIAK